MPRRPTLKLPDKAETPQPTTARTGTVRPKFGVKPLRKKAEADTAPAAAPATAEARTSAGKLPRAAAPRRVSASTSDRRKAEAPAPASRPPRPRTPAPRAHVPARDESQPVPRSEPSRPDAGGATTAKQRFYETASPAVVAPPTRSRAARHAGAAGAAPDLPRLSKIMSERELCSRREADEWIRSGWVRVDGQVVSVLGTRVAPDVRIEIDPAATRLQGEAVTFLLHKPIGYVSGQAEEGHRPAMVLLRAQNRWSEDPLPLRFQPSHLRGLAPAGRLDIDSAGLLVFTQDGRVARRLIGDDSTVEKEYLVRVEGTLSPQALRQLNHGLSLDGAKLKPAKVSWQNEDQLRFVLREGKKRQIRRMCELVGLKVVGLKRIRIGSVALGKLPPGKWRYLRADEKF